MGSGDRHEHLALGDTPNLAARLQSLAVPETIVISDATSRLVQGYFTCQELGVQALKGIDTPVRMSQVGGKARRRAAWTSPRSTAGSPRALTPLTCKRPGHCSMSYHDTLETEGFPLDMRCCERIICLSDC